eukprot:scaffold11434_cov127-Isochrysis_galbana.AAC.13
MICEYERTCTAAGRLSVLYQGAWQHNKSTVWNTGGAGDGEGGPNVRVTTGEIACDGPGARTAMHAYTRQVVQ